MKIGSLFSGYAGLDLAVAEHFNAETVWFAEFEDAPSKILANHFPTIPNHRDVTTIDWTAVEPVDIITGGFPCQDVSMAGKRTGMTEGTRSNLWGAMRTAIETIRPRYVVAENVRGLLSATADSDLESCQGCVGETEHREHTMRALGRVLGDLADIGYDAQWYGLRAADIGAPHGRFRVFILATDAPSTEWGGEKFQDLGATEGSASKHRECLGRRGGDQASADTSSSTVGQHPGGSSQEETRQASSDGSFDHRGERPAVNWGPYEPAIRRWGHALGRSAPAPTALSPLGRHQLSPTFVEWLMGLPEGWVTDIDISRSEQLKALGNGVVPQQALAALDAMGGQL